MFSASKFVEDKWYLAFLGYCYVLWLDSNFEQVINSTCFKTLY